MKSEVVVRKNALLMQFDLRSAEAFWTRHMNLLHIEKLMDDAASGWVPERIRHEIAYVWDPLRYRLMKLTHK